MHNNSNTPPRRRVSLRALALELGVNVSSLSTAIRDGSLRAGVGFDAKGRALVLDADACAAEWRTSRMPRVDYLARREARRTTAPPAACRCTIWDRDGYDWTAQELLEANASDDLIIRALLRARLDAGEDPEAIIAATSPRVRAEALEPGDSFTDADVARAELSLSTTIALLDDDDDDDEPDDERI